jgi:hypothetical protein
MLGLRLRSGSFVIVVQDSYCTGTLTSAKDIEAVHPRRDCFGGES